IGNLTFYYLNTNGNPLSLPKLATIIGTQIFHSAKTGAIDLPALTTINSNKTFYNLKTNGNPLSLPKLTTITGGDAFYYTTTGAIDLPSLTSITGYNIFHYLKSSTLTLRTNLKISKTNANSAYDNFYFCCYEFQGDTFLNLLYSTEDGTTSGTPITEVTLNLGTEPTSPDAAVAGKWRMNAGEFLTKLKTITLRPAEEEMVIPDVFTVKGAPWKSPLALDDGILSDGVYTWTKPST
ncbi:MAG: leucine-rich repeat protein, partial [Holosporales bacterium]|nr:leucine-rich repeat protein [Holosporales bacterium]